MAAARSGAARKRHVQRELFRHGGKRKGAGRKPTHGRAGAPHKKRDEIDGRDVLHVVLRAVSGVGSLRRREVYKAVRAASATAAGTEARRGRFRIVQLSIQHDHIHMLVEAESTEALASGMQGFQISAARHINSALRAGGRRRRGSVFADRYHLVVIRSPKQARHVLAYVMNNWRKHGEDRSGLAATGW
ncbi:MAG: transposase [Kofleriaceae bacterium]